MAPSSKASLSVLFSAFLASISFQSVQATPFKRLGHLGIDKRQVQVTVSPPGVTPVLVEYVPDLSTFSLLSLGPDGLPIFTTTASATASTVNEYPTIETPPVEVPPSSSTTPVAPPSAPAVETTSSPVEETTTPVGDSNANPPASTPCTTTSSQAPVVPPVEQPTTTATTPTETPVQVSTETPAETPLDTPVDTPAATPSPEPSTPPVVETTYPVDQPPTPSIEEPSTTAVASETSVGSPNPPPPPPPAAPTPASPTTTIRTTSTSTSTSTFTPTDRPTFNPEVTATPISISTTHSGSLILVSYPSVSTFPLIPISNGVPLLSSGETTDCLSRPTVYVTVTADFPSAETPALPSPETTSVGSQAAQPSVRVVTSWTTSTTTVCPTQPTPCP